MGLERRVQPHRAFLKKTDPQNWPEMRKEKREIKMTPWFPPFANPLLGPHIAVDDVKVWEVLSGGDDRRVEIAEISGFQEKLLCARSRPWASHQYLT